MKIFPWLVISLIMLNPLFHKRMSCVCLSYLNFGLGTFGGFQNTQAVKFKIFNLYYYKRLMVKGNILVLKVLEKIVYIAKITDM